MWSAVTDKRVYFVVVSIGYWHGLLARLIRVALDNRYAVDIRGICEGLVVVEVA